MVCVYRATRVLQRQEQKEATE